MRAKPLRALALAAATTALSLLTCVSAVADDEKFRCGQWVVSQEISVTELVSKCGEPASKRVSDVVARNEFGGVAGITHVEIWRYDRGARAAAMIVTVIDGHVQRMEREGSSD